MSQIMYAGSKRKATALDRYRSKKKSRSTSKRMIGRAFTNFVPASRIVPDRLVTTLHYHEIVSMSDGAGGDQQWNLNSLFDPNRSGTGHQPLGFDQLATLYQRYRVLKASWKVQCTNVFGPIIPLIAVVPTNNTTSLATTIDTACELPYSQNKLMGGQYTAAGSTAQPATIKGSCSLAKIYGCTESELKGSDRYQALVSADPSETAILHCVFNEIAGGVDGAVTFCVDIFYTVEMFDRIQLAAS